MIESKSQTSYGKLSGKFDYKIQFESSKFSYFYLYGIEIELKTIGNFLSMESVIQSDWGWIEPAFCESVSFLPKKSEPSEKAKMLRRENVMDDKDLNGWFMPGRTLLTRGWTWRRWGTSRIPSCRGRTWRRASGWAAGRTDPSYCKAMKRLNSSGSCTLIEHDIASTCGTTDTVIV